MARTALLTTAVLGAALLLSGCSAAAAKAPDAARTGTAATAKAAAAAPATLPACRKPPAGTLPHSAGFLDQHSSGSYCLGVGKRIDIFLTAASGGRWREVQVSNHAVVAPANTGVLTAPLGVTPAMFTGTARGTTVLSSSTPSGRTWRVTLVVS